MPVAQMVTLTHPPVRPGMLADPTVATTINPSWDQINRAISTMDADRFMVLLGTRLDLEASADPDALAIEFGEGLGFMLYQLGFTSDVHSNSWRSRSAENAIIPSTVNLDTVLRIVAAHGKGTSFDEISSSFPEV
jgi:hypothetical protein